MVLSKSTFCISRADLTEGLTFLSDCRWTNCHFLRLHVVFINDIDFFLVAPISDPISFEWNSGTVFPVL